MWVSLPACVFDISLSSQNGNIIIKAFCLYIKIGQFNYDAQRVEEVVRIGWQSDFEICQTR